ncbi:hypothetical protein BT93_L4237 [Corymbia citriodora subsp. variegata]|uniref:Uncharacterized protein n=1 Tax=Corymbia citriodora subsp. variegata TaxID=360336 RepID=A0A8T0CKG0_CORYI|nr:hypothetical protein BT93_L4237 [Corymbia citriodora subsp. variegata]
MLMNEVWNELEKENKEFFEEYVQSQSKDDRMSQEETNQMIQKIISSSDSTSKDSHHDINDGAGEHSNPNV